MVSKRPFNTTTKGKIQLNYQKFPPPQNHIRIFYYSVNFLTSFAMLLRRLLLALLLIYGRLLAQNTIALPDIVSYSKQTYNAGPANWGICQDKKGIIYVANDEGLLTFDGSFWKRYSLPSSATIRSLALASDGKLYIGSSGEIGFYEADENGLLNYTSLNNLIPDSEKDFTEVWNVVIYGDAIFFRSYKRIFELRNNKITVYKGLSWSYLGTSNGRLISKAFGKGLLVFQNDRWAPFIKGDTLAEKAQVSAQTIRKLHAGDFDESALRSVAPVLNLNGRALGETLQDGHLRGEHVALVDGGDGALGFVFDTFGGVSDKHARGVNHGLRCGFALRCGGFLCAEQAGLHPVDFHHDVG